MARVLFIIFGVLLTLWGIYRMKNDDALFGKNQKSKNIFNLILLGEASGIGQFLGGIVTIIIGVLSFIIK
ncbi:MAG: hypothetical protein KH369_13915 [Paraclostridium bifermentans]|uniref:hypothetical protein n=1 Tax=Paraclostridium TaxID=1849822 RepID=UPI0011DDF881|nr:hypothetical protein [Paraclostridium bifermentans]MBS6509292.1 hypothetical protein [Paraclostridium bifermentans]MDU3803496.1 hypothetical protein [Paraclostridium bifermentans]